MTWTGSGLELDNKLFVSEKVICGGWVVGGCIWNIESAPVPFLRFEILDL